MKAYVNTIAYHRTYLHIKGINGLITALVKRAPIANELDIGNFHYLYRIVPNGKLL